MDKISFRNEIVHFSYGDKNKFTKWILWGDAYNQYWVFYTGFASIQALMISLQGIHTCFPFEFLKLKLKFKFAT